MRTLLVVLLVCALVWESEAWFRRRRRRTSSNCGSPPSGAGVSRWSCNWPFQNGETCNFRCRSGYTFVSGSAVRTCNNGAWSGAAYICAQQQRGCSTPFKGRGVSRRGCFWPYRHGETCTFSCRRRYTYVSGSSVRTCNNGAWSGAAFLCQR
ncbi:P-selectin-like [Branchiostoma lanceolatum]|uniref:P-selectin-like n=1 Tax=Branchiostoma lanceolatum TaxID=7740 RepID=UPI003455BA10